MDQRLAEAARVGDVVALHRILEEDPQILEKACLGHFTDSPLHVAAMAGKVDFVKQIVPLMPSLVTATNQHGLIPLHMASAQGHVKIVKELLKARLEDEVNQCLVKDDDGWTALHYTVFRGRLGVIQELTRHCPECVEEVTAKGETILHIAVKANQFEAVKMMVDSIKRLPNFQTLLGAKDHKGKTVYDLAAAKKQFSVIQDIGKEEGKDEIKEETRITMEVKEAGPKASGNIEKGASWGDSAEEQAEKHHDKKNNFDETLGVVATLIITLTYQALVNPPSSLIKHDTQIDWGCIFQFYPSPENTEYGMISSIDRCPAFLAFFFLIMNTGIFIQGVLVLAMSLRGIHGLLQFLLLSTILCLTLSYCALLAVFSIQIVYVAIILGLFAILYYLLGILVFFINRYATAKNPWRGLSNNFNFLY